MKKLYTLLLFFIVGFCYAQDITGNISSKETLLLKLNLKYNRVANIKVNTLIKLARYNVFKHGEEEQDLDSAAIHLTEAGVLNKTIGCQLCRGRILLTHATFYETAQKENAISNLEARTNLQQAKLIHADMTKRWVVGFICLLILLLAIFIDKYLVKRRMNKLLNCKYSESRKINENLTVEKSGLIAEKVDLINEKQWLLNEVHHRVKNNLHTVVSLLESQAQFLKNDALKAIEKSQHRIHAMSLIHRELYGNELTKTVDISVFVPEFIRYLKDSYNVHQKVLFQLNVASIKLGLSYAIPVALIINEVITNAIQHAFKNKALGKINVAIYQTGKLVTIVIWDDGIGILIKESEMPSDSLGLILIKGLSEEINAEVSIESGNGTKVTVAFNMEEVEE